MFTLFSAQGQALADDADVLEKGRFLIFRRGQIAYLSRIIRDDDNPIVGVHFLRSGEILERHKGKPAVAKSLPDDFDYTAAAYRRIHLGDATAMALDLDTAVKVRNAILDIRKGFDAKALAHKKFGKRLKTLVDKAEIPGVDAEDIDMTMEQE